MYFLLWNNAMTALASSSLPIYINEFGLSGMIPKRIENVVIKIEKKFIPKRTLHRIDY